MLFSLLVLLVKLGFIFIESVDRTANPSTPIQQQVTAIYSKFVLKKEIKHSVWIPQGFQCSASGAGEEDGHITILIVAATFAGAALGRAAQTGGHAGRGTATENREGLPTCNQGRS